MVAEPPSVVIRAPMPIVPTGLPFRSNMRGVQRWRALRWRGTASRRFSVGEQDGPAWQIPGSEYRGLISAARQKVARNIHVSRHISMVTITRWSDGAEVRVREGSEMCFTLGVALPSAAGARARRLGSEEMR
jgi:hypothetical protein